MTPFYFTLFRDLYINIIGDDNMATSSFFTDITINDKKTAKKFLEAMEKAEKANKKRINVKYKTIDNKDTIYLYFENDFINKPSN